MATIYFDTTRSTPLTKEEQQLVDSIIQRYILSFALPDAEQICTYVKESDADSLETVLYGSVSLPSYEVSEMVYASEHWLKCLTEIRKNLPDCKWKVSIEEEEVPWFEEVGYLAGFHELKEEVGDLERNSKQKPVRNWWWPF